MTNHCLRTMIALLLCLILAVPASASWIGPGYMFYFGSFEQDNFTVDGKEPIIWRVLDTDEANGRVLAVSEFGLYTMKYNRTNKTTAWGDTDVRDWLNSSFLSSFTPEELEKVIITSVSGSSDRFFLLDAGQISRYLSSPYLCYATPWALLYGEEGAYVNDQTGASSWLVRTDVATKRIAWVGGAGMLYSPEGKKGVNYLTSKDNVVRPAMWVRKEAAGNEAPASYRFPLYARTKMKISTRSGPTTGYNGIGDYFSRGGELVRVLSRVHDGSIWWLQIEFEYKGSLVRCYTGLKRVNIDISRVPDEPGGTLGTGTVVIDGTAYYGPGVYYKQQVEKFTPARGTTGDIISEEIGWYCLEYTQGKEKIRVWLPSEALEIQ